MSRIDEILIKHKETMNNTVNQLMDDHDKTMTQLYGEYVAVVLDNKKLETALAVQNCKLPETLREQAG